MKISSETLNILKNFSTINQSLIVEPGNVLKSISPMKNILVYSEIIESFPCQFAIYELTEFLSGLTLFRDPDFDFSNSSFVTISNGHSKVKYFFSDPNLIISPPKKDLELPSVEVNFNLSSETLNILQRASSIYNLSDLSIVGNDGKIELVVSDNKNNTSNNYCVNVGETNSTFKFNFKVENIKILSGNYDVSISSHGISLFENTSRNLKYWIALEPNSTMEK